jgi:hypothetical protein
VRVGVKQADWLFLMFYPNHWVPAPFPQIGLRNTETVITERREGESVLCPLRLKVPMWRSRKHCSSSSKQ